MTFYKWINLYPLAETTGFVYFKAYVATATNQVVGWVNRTGSVEPYSYSVYWLDASGQTQTSTRGTWQHADWSVQGAVASVAAGLAAAMKMELLPHLPSCQLSALEQVKRLMGDEK